MQDVSDRLVFHPATGHLVARLASCGLGDAGLAAWTSGQLLPHFEAFRTAGGVLRQADLDFSHNGLTDVGLSALLAAWKQMEVSCPLLLKLHFNRLADASLGHLAAFIRTYRGQVRELHLTDNSFSEQKTVGEFLASFSGLPQYPMWIRRQRRYAPVYARLGNCGLSSPQVVLEQSQGSIAICLMEDRGCSRTLCSLAERGSGRGCPLVHLYGFLDQSTSCSSSSMLSTAGETEQQGMPKKRRGEAPCPTSGSPLQGRHPAIDGVAITVDTEMYAEAPVPEPESEACLQSTRQDMNSFDCGACGKFLPLDMFGRHQFRKVAIMDSPRSAEDSGTPLHLVRRCNDCVLQPCSACGIELPLSRFAKGQMMRPRGQRRCRECAVETVLCVRCGQPKPRAAFSPVEAHKRKLAPRVCNECEHTNPYFERRYGLVLTLGSHRCCSGSARRLPPLPLEILQRVASFSEPGDEFTRVHRRDFECGLCGRSWNLSTNDVDRHVRHSQLHKKRLESLNRGLLLRVSSLDMEVSRLRNGLGIRGDVCSRERVEEARALLRVEEVKSQGIALEALMAAGVAPGCNWVAPRLVELAVGMQLGAATPPEASAATASSAVVRSAQRRWKLFGHLGAEAEGHADAEEQLSAISAMLGAE